MSTFDETGLIVDRLPTIIKNFEDDSKASFGADFKVDPESVNGQLILNFAGVFAQQNEIIEAVANIFNPNSVGGFFQSMMVSLNGLKRKESKFSTVPLEVVAGTENCFIPKGSIVTEVNNENDWVLDADVSLVPFEAKTTTATCSKAGAINSDPNDITVIKTPEYSWESVTNTAKAVPGNTEENDVDLRIRRTTASKKKGQCSEKATFIEISNIESVTSLNIIVNDGEVTDANGIPPQHYLIIVRGGTDEEVAGAMVDSIGGGIGTVGDVYINYYDEETGKYYEFNFSRPTDINTFIKMELKKGVDFPLDGEATIKQNIIDLYAGTFEDEAGFDIGEPVVYSRLYSAINSVGGHSVASLLLGLTAPPTGSVDLPMNIDEQGFIDASQIEIVTV